MKCPRCGMEVADNGRFCENCGAPLGNDRVAAPRTEQTQPNTAPVADAAPHETPQQEQPYGQQSTQDTQSYEPYGIQSTRQPDSRDVGQQVPPPQQMPTSPAQPQGSNAPFVLAIIALVTAILGLFPVSIVLAIIALVMNSRQKKRGETSTKQTPTFVMGLISLILSALMAVFTAMVGGAVWLAVMDDDIDLEHITESTAPAAVAESPVGTWDVDTFEADGESYGSDYLEMMRGIGMYIQLLVRSDGTVTLDVLGETLDGTWEDKGGGTIELMLDGEAETATLSGDELTLASDDMKIGFHRASTSVDEKASSSSSSSESKSSSSSNSEKSSASSSSASSSYTDVGRPKKKEFDWVTDKIRSGTVPQDATKMKKAANISGEWKAYIEYKDHSGVVVVYDLLNIDIEAGDRAASVKFDWYKSNYGDGWVEDTSKAVTLDGTFDSGTVSVYGDYANATFDTFYKNGDKQYGIGSMMLPSGEMADIFLVRP